jgi:hypothetical protein
MTNEIQFELKRAAEWREEKACEYPSDTRNNAAVEVLRRLSDQDMSRPVAERYEAAVATYTDLFSGIDDIDGIEQFISHDDMVESMTGETYRGIGFDYHPGHIDDVAKGIIDDYETATERVSDSIKRARAAEMAA